VETFSSPEYYISPKNAALPLFSSSSRVRQRIPRLISRIAVSPAPVSPFLGPVPFRVLHEIAIKSSRRISKYGARHRANKRASRRLCRPLEMFKRRGAVESIINAVVKADPRGNECQTDAKFARHSIFGSSAELRVWRTRADLTETNERESPSLTPVCISPSSAICMKRNGGIVTQSRTKRSEQAPPCPPTQCWNSANEQQREGRSTKTPRREQKAELLFALHRQRINGRYGHPRGDTADPAIP